MPVCNEAGNGAASSLETYAEDSFNAQGGKTRFTEQERINGSPRYLKAELLTDWAKDMLDSYNLQKKRTG